MLYSAYGADCYGCTVHHAMEFVIVDDVPYEDVIAEA